MERFGLETLSEFLVRTDLKSRIVSGSYSIEPYVYDILVLEKDYSQSKLEHFLQSIAAREPYIFCLPGSKQFDRFPRQIFEKVEVPHSTVKILLDDGTWIRNSGVFINGKWIRTREHVIQQLIHSNCEKNQLLCDVLDRTGLKSKIVEGFFNRNSNDPFDESIFRLPRGYPPELLEEFLIFVSRYEPKSRFTKNGLITNHFELEVSAAKVIFEDGSYLENGNEEYCGCCWIYLSADGQRLPSN